VRLVAVLLLLAAPLAAWIAPTSVVMAAGCVGDEQLLLAPARPRVGGLLIVAAVSRAPHEQALLLGPTGPIEAGRAAIGDRFVWQGWIVPDHPGEHVFAFGVGGGAAPLASCADATIVVEAAGASGEFPTGGELARGSAAPVSGAVHDSVLFPLLHPWLPDGSLPVASGAPPDAGSDLDDPSLDTVPPNGSDGDAPRSTSTRRPTRTPTRRPAPDNGNANGNENDNVGNVGVVSAADLSAAAATPTKTPTPTRTPTLARTPTPTRTPRPDPTNTPRPDPTDTPAPTPTLAPPSIAGISPGSALCGQSLTVSGQRFGSSRSAVDGRVRIDGVEASIVSWSMSEVEVLVPLTARPGNDRLLEVIVAGASTSRTLRVSC
jgi:hypothetical protein